MIEYQPLIYDQPNVITDKPSAWSGLETIIKDIVQRFNIKTENALEFGVEFGFSTTALAHYFKNVIGIDTFIGEFRTVRYGEDHYEETASRLKPYTNIQLIKSKYQDWIKLCDQTMIYDIIHIDIVHTYLDTYNCGEWSVKHSKVTLFHDTESFPDVKRACKDLAAKYNLEFYNYPECYGLGILINPHI